MISHNTVLLEFENIYLPMSGLKGDTGNPFLSYKFAPSGISELGIPFL